MRTPAQQAADLRKLQWLANKDIDRLYAPVGAEAEAIIRRHAVTLDDGTQTITPDGKRMILRELEAALTRLEPKVTMAIADAVTRAADLGEAD